MEVLERTAVSTKVRLSKEMVTLVITETAAAAAAAALIGGGILVCWRKCAHQQFSCPGVNAVSYSLMTTLY